MKSWFGVSLVACLVLAAGLIGCQKDLSDADIDRIVDRMAQKPAPTRRGGRQPHSRHDDVPSEVRRVPQGRQMGRDVHERSDGPSGVSDDASRGLHHGHPHGGGDFG